MRLEKKLASLIAVPLLGASIANADMLIDYCIIDLESGLLVSEQVINGKNVDVLTQNKNYRLAIQLNSTGSPSTEVGTVGTDVMLYRGPNWASNMNFNGSSLASGTNSFFDGYATSYHLDNDPGSDGYLTPNDITLTNPLAGGPSNKVGYLFYFDFTPTALIDTLSPTRFGFSPSNPYVSDKLGNPVTTQYDRDYVAVVPVPEPNTASLLIAAGAAGVGLANVVRRARRGNHPYNNENTHNNSRVANYNSRQMQRNSVRRRH